MKKYLFILALVGTALFTACASSDELIAEAPSQGLTEEEKALIVEAGKDSDVPITLGSVGSKPSGMTRTPIENDANDLFETPDGKYFGVFCLAMGKQVGAPSFIGDDVMWSAAYATSYPYANWMENIPAKVVKYEKDPSSPIEGGEDEDYNYVQFMNKDNLSATKVYYYPFGNWYYYDFFAYYPKQNDGDDVVVNAKSCIVKFTIDGSQDIIWGKAISEDNSGRLYALEDPSDESSTKVYAYSSKYLRLKKDAGSEEYDVVPGLELKHKLTQFVFSVKAHDASNAAQLYAKGFRLANISLKDVYHKLQLVVASKDENVTAGELSIIAPTESPSHYTDISVKATDDSNPFPIVIAGSSTDIDLKEVGYAIVPSSDLISGKTHNEYVVYLTMQQKDEAGKYPGDEGYSGDDVPDTVITLTPPAGGFVAGNKYKITLDIYSPTQIQATATLEGWVSPNDTDHNQTISVD